MLSAHKRMSLKYLHSSLTCIKKLLPGIPKKQEKFRESLRRSYKPIISFIGLMITWLTWNVNHFRIFLNFFNFTKKCGRSLSFGRIFIYSLFTCKFIPNSRYIPIIKSNLLLFGTVLSGKRTSQTASYTVWIIPVFIVS